MNRKILTEALQEIQFLHNIAPGYLEQRANISHIRDFAETEVVFREGDPANHR